MKKIYILSILFLMLFAFNINVKATYAYTGAGTSVDPYQISSIEDLYHLNFVNADTKFAILTKSLDFNDDASYLNPTDTSYGDVNQDGTTDSIKTEFTTSTGWVPLGYLDASGVLLDTNVNYATNLNGNGYDINHLFINRPTTNNVGFISTQYSNYDVANGGLFNINFINVSITGYDNTGLTGYSYYGNLENIYLSGTIAGHDYTAGFAGYNMRSNFVNLVNDADVTGNNYVGGIAGKVEDNGSYLLGTNLVNNGNITAYNFAGGIFGRTALKKTYNVYNTGNVTATNGYAGGIIGENYGSILQYAYNTGTINADKAGGLYGYHAYNYFYTLTNAINLGSFSDNSTYAPLIYDRSSSNQYPNITDKSVYRFDFIENSTLATFNHSSVSYYSWTDNDTYGEVKTISDLYGIIGENGIFSSGQWDFSSVDSGSLPTLFMYNTTTPLANQTSPQLLTYGIFVQLSADQMIYETGDIATITASFSTELSTAPTIEITSPEVVAISNMTATLDPKVWTFSFDVTTTNSGQLIANITSEDIGDASLIGGTNIAVTSYIINYDLSITNSSETITVSNYTLNADHEFRYYSLDNGTTWTDIGSDVLTYDLTSIPDGNYTVKIKGVATNESINTINLIVDTTAPELFLNNDNKVTIQDSTYMHTVALRENHDVYVWGVNDYGQLGNNTMAQSTSPLNITSDLGLQPGEYVTLVAAGSNHTVLATSNNRVIGFGNNTYHAISSSSTTTYFPITDITSEIGLEPTDSITFIDAGNTNTYILTDSNKLFVIGENSNGQLSTGTIIDINSYTDVSSNLGLNAGETISFLEVGWQHAALITSNNRVLIWGDGANYKLGNQSTADKSTPVDITSKFSLDTLNGEIPLMLSVSYDNTGLVTSLGNVYLWGDGSYYQNASNSSADLSLPTNKTASFNNLHDGEMITSISYSRFNGYATTSENRVFSWGSNTYYDLGINSTLTQYAPVEISSNESFVDITTGFHYAIALTDQGYLYGWGYNSSNGLTGLGNTNSYIYVPTILSAFEVSDHITVAQNSQWTDPGATAFDNLDGELTVVVGGDVFDINTSGVYVVTYDATDSAGNSAVQVTRTITVGDVDAPVITLIGDSVISVAYGSTYVELGATYLDNADGYGDAIVSGDTVDTSVIGSYTITYNITDIAGNVAEEVTRTVNVVDLDGPVISLVGDQTVNIEYGETYNELGATYIDNIDPSGDAIVSGDTVDNLTLGTYVITYNATDSSNNHAIEVTRTVNVVDTTSPVITLTGDEIIILELNATYTELGATYTDNYDQSGAATVSGDTVDTTIIGDYIVTYNAIDSEGNIAIEITRTVTVVDTTSPVIILNGDATLTLEYGDTYIELGATYTDNYDQSGDAIVAGDTVNSFVLGSYTITYNATDASNNSAVEVTRTVYVVDTTDPVLVLNGDDTINIEFDSTYTELGATFTDNVDTTGQIVVGGDTVDTSVLGTYIVTYNFTDASNNSATEITRTINVIDTTAPTITLNGDDNINVEYGETYTELGATFTDNYDGTGDALVSGDTVDTSVLGTYYVTYDYTDSHLNVSIQVTRTIHVVDTTAPIISLVGAQIVSIEYGQTYIEFGATFTDNYDGTGAATVSGDTVDTSILGTYVVTYNVTDSQGNVATEVTRTVTVVDTSAPTFDLIENQTIEVKTSDVDWTTLILNAIDNVDETLINLEVLDTVNYQTLGYYYVTVSVTDQSNNASSQTFSVEVVDTTAPILQLVGDSEMTLESGDAYVELGATFTDNYDMNGTVVISGDTVDTQTIGSYLITYNFTDTSGNEALEITRTVHIVDTTAPTFTGVYDTQISTDQITIDFEEGHATLNGVAYISGTVITEAGTYTFTITDDYQNSQTITFEIQSTTLFNLDPIILYSGAGLLGLLLLIAVIILFRKKK